MIESETLKADGIAHGFFTRRGGASSGIYASLNCGYGSQDELDDVLENRARVAQRLGTDPAKLLSVHQIHSRDVIVADAPWDAPRPKADAIVTRIRGLAVSVLTADCAPVLFADVEAGVVGAAHAGWKGAKLGVIAATVEAMEGQGAKRERISATVGPAISQDAYEVGPEFEAAFAADDPAHRQYFRPGSGGRPYFDLPAFCLARLREAGVGQANLLPQCTYGNESLFFSFRRSTHRSEPDYGRQISAIVVL